MSNVVQFTLDLDTLRQLMGLPESVRIVRCHSVPDAYVFADGMRFVMESPQFPDAPTGSEIPTVVPNYDQSRDGSMRFKGFQIVSVPADPVPPRSQADEGL